MSRDMHLSACVGLGWWSVNIASIPSPMLGRGTKCKCSARSDGSLALPRCFTASQLSCLRMFSEETLILSE